MKMIIPKYICRMFLVLFVFGLASTTILFLVLDVVENMDRFIDKKVPIGITIQYYLYYLPAIIVLVLPVVSLLATVFSVGTLSKHNELIALKALGFSLYQVITIICILGIFISLFSFLISELLVSGFNQKKETIYRENISKKKRLINQIQNIQIQEPDGVIVTIGSFNTETQTASQIRVERFLSGKLIERFDTPQMDWTDRGWETQTGYKRFFNGTTESAKRFDEPMQFRFLFTPEDLHLFLVRPDEHNMIDLYRYIRRIREAGGRVHRWMTDFHFRFSFPLSNAFIVFLSVPLAYNRRKKSLVVGFGFSLAICFLYFGLVKMGQTLGHNGGLNPVVSAWLGNCIAFLGGAVNLFFARK